LAYLQDAARFAYLSAWRIGAVRALEWRDVDFAGRTLQLRASSAKNKRAKTIPLVGDLLGLLERRAVDRDPACSSVFRGRDVARSATSGRPGTTRARQPGCEACSSTICGGARPGTPSAPVFRSRW